MGKDGPSTLIATFVIAALVAAQGYLSYRIFLLDSIEHYSEIPFLLGVTILLYAVILFIYLRVFIGVNAYKKTKDVH